MKRLREAIAALISAGMLFTPVWGASSTSGLGMLVYADRAHVGAAPASVGATIFDGDRLSTEQTGSVQMRAGAARLLLNGASSATLADDNGMPTATLASGSATFSTAKSNALAVRFGNAVIRAQNDGPTIGQITVLNAKQLVVKSTRGALTVTVDDDSRVIPEGMAYRIVLDPAAAPQPRAVASPRPQGPPIKAGRSKFVWYAIAAAGIVTYLAVSEALESPDRP
jgi:hypothetical protein